MALESTKTNVESMDDDNEFKQNLCDDIQEDFLQFAIQEFKDNFTVIYFLYYYFISTKMNVSTLS